MDWVKNVSQDIRSSGRNMNQHFPEFNINVMVERHLTFGSSLEFQEEGWKFRVGPNIAWH
jgi:hypothetical protein